MSLPQHQNTPLSDIHDIHRRLNERFASHLTHDLDYRVYNLKQLGYLIKDNEDLLRAALKRDLDKGPRATDMEEVDPSFLPLWPILNEIDLAVRKVPKWMKSEGRAWDAIQSFSIMKPVIKKQPKGVVLIIGPWNYPLQCSLIPLVNAIAAGCPAVLKPSELAPHSSALFAQLIPQYLDPEAYAVVLGGPEQASKLLEKQWGHIIYTGSGRVGKIVAEAAARTLTPTTLELGGKSPVIIADDANVKIAAKRMLSIKQFNIGQMCVGPDHVLCVRSRLDDFLSACRETLEELWPRSPHPQSFLHTDATARLSSRAGFERQKRFLATAESEGTLWYKGEVDEERMRMGVSIVLLDDDKKDGGGLREEEIFGPVLPVIPVDDVPHAIRYINARPNPLALYLFTSDARNKRKVANETLSGSLTINDVGLITINRSLPFGGVGDSGWGAYHGEDGFNLFTHRKSMLSSPLWTEPLMNIRYPPLVRWKQVLGKAMFVVPLAFSRPVSVEHEAWKRRRRVIAKYVVAVLLALVGGGWALARGYKYNMAR